MGAKVIGLVVPEAVDSIPAKSVLMYPGIAFIARGIALQSLSAAGYDEAMERVIRQRSILPRGRAGNYAHRNLADVPSGCGIQRRAG